MFSREALLLCCAFRVRVGMLGIAFVCRVKNSCCFCVCVCVCVREYACLCARYCDCTWSEEKLLLYCVRVCESEYACEYV